MATADTGLFGPTPWEIQQAQQQALQTQAANYAQQTPFQRAAQGMFTAGEQLGGMGAQALGGVNVAQQQAAQNQQALQGADLQTPDGLRALALKVKDYNPNAAVKLVQKAAEMEKEKADIELSKAHAKYWERGGASASDQNKRIDYTTDKGKVIQRDVSGKFYEAGTDNEIDPATLAGVKLFKIGTEKVTGDSTVIKPYVDESGKVVYGAGKDLVGKEAAGSSPTVAGNIQAAKAGAKTGNEIALGDYKTAKSASDVIPKIDNLITQLQNGNVSTGSMADIRLGVNKAIALLGGKDAAQRATDTEIAAAMMNSEVYPLVQSLGVGARGMDTPAEREFLRSALTGSLSMEKGTLLKMAQNRRDDLQKSLDQWDSSVTRGERDDFLRNNGIPKVTFGKQVTPTQPQQVQQPVNPFGRIKLESLADVQSAVASKKLTPQQAIPIMRDLDAQGKLK